MNDDHAESSHLTIKSEEPVAVDMEPSNNHIAATYIQD